MDWNQTLHQPLPKSRVLQALKHHLLYDLPETDALHHPPSGGTVIEIDLESYKNDPTGGPATLSALVDKVQQDHLPHLIGDQPLDQAVRLVYAPNTNIYTDYPVFMVALQLVLRALALDRSLEVYLAPRFFHQAGLRGGLRYQLRHRITSNMPGDRVTVQQIINFLMVEMPTILPPP